MPFPLATAVGSSFPSSHAVTSAAGTIVLVLLARRIIGRPRRGVAALTAVIPLAIGLSRLMLGVHHVSDVVAGWLLGTAWALAAARALRIVPESLSRSPGPASPAAPNPPRGTPDG